MSESNTNLRALAFAVAAELGLPAEPFAAALVQLVAEMKQFIADGRGDATAAALDSARRHGATLITH